MIINDALFMFSIQRVYSLYTPLVDIMCTTVQKNKHIFVISL
jgi:hypothetical protein